MAEQNHETEQENYDFLKEYDEDEEIKSYEPKEESDFETVPDGKYQVFIDRVEITYTKQDSKPMLKWTLTILAGKYVGRKLFKNNLLVSKDNIKWMLDDLMKCGIRLSQPSQLPDVLNDLLDRVVEIQIKNKRDESDENKIQQNVYFNKFVSSSKDSAAAQAPTPAQSAAIDKEFGPGGRNSASAAF